MNDTCSIHRIYEYLQLRVFFLIFHSMIVLSPDSNFSIFESNNFSRFELNFFLKAPYLVDSPQILSNKASKSRSGIVKCMSWQQHFFKNSGSYTGTAYFWYSSLIHLLTKRINFESFNKLLLSFHVPLPLLKLLIKNVTSTIKWSLLYPGVIFILSVKSVKPDDTII